MYLQQMRFGDRITYRKDCSVDADKVIVPAFTFQPLVENAIFSGIEPGGKNGTIRIHAYEKDKCLCVDVRDDGIGIPEEKIPELLNHSEKLKGDQMSSIGMPNEDRRLKLIYGEEYGLSVESQVGEYTQITVRIPLEY